MPADVPAAATWAEPALPKPPAWPGAEAFPRTSGTGRLYQGGMYWTDWIYDDHGAAGSPRAPGAPGADPAEQGSPSYGDYTYPSGPSDNNGADIFRAGVLLTPGATVWRVDWNTLQQADVPIAEWTFATGTSKQAAAAWPAGAGVSSPGIDKALVVSARGAQLINAVSGAVLARFPVAVDMASKSFVVSVPRTVLAPAGTWTIRLAAGLSNPAGTGFAPPPGTAPNAVYNVAFRTIAQEAAVSYNFWNDDAQATALLQGDVSSFSYRLAWSDLAARRTAPEAAPSGWSDRWYVSTISEGQGRSTDVNTLYNNKSAYFGVVQPYAVYVPTSYRPGRSTALTFLLHSLTQNHNQYAATTPQFSAQACQDRQSICVTTLGRGPSGFYNNDAQLDFWQVWHDVATHFSLDPGRTVLSGYSMGGIGTYALAEAHPDLFARAVGLAGALAGNTPLLENLRWIPTYLAGGAEDELVPVSQEKAMADELDSLGYRYRWLLYPTEDHVAFELQDGFADAAAYMGHDTVVTRPGRITFRWNASENNSEYGYGITGAYWLKGLTARTAAADSVIDATSSGDPDAPVIQQRSRSVDPTADPTPAVITQLTWASGKRPVPGPVVTISLINVAALTLDPAGAGFAPGQHYQVVVNTDGPGTLTVDGHAFALHQGRNVVSEQRA